MTLEHIKDRILNLYAYDIENQELLREHWVKSECSPMVTLPLTAIHENPVLLSLVGKIKVSSDTINCFLEGNFIFLI